MWKCQKCDLKFETEEELEGHQSDEDICAECCSSGIEISKESMKCRSCDYEWVRI